MRAANVRQSIIPREWNTIITSHGLLMIFGDAGDVRRLQPVRATDDRRARHGVLLNNSFAPPGLSSPACAG
jgi:hypothetical protein